MMSAISVAADSHGQDAMLFITIGEMDESIPETNLSDDKVDSNVKPESDRERRHGVDSPHSEDEDGLFQQSLVTVQISCYDNAQQIKA